MIKKQYKSAVISEVIELTNAILEEENVDADFKAEFDPKQMVFDALYIQTTDIPAIPLGSVKVSILQTYDSDTGLVNQYQYVILRGKAIKCRFESPDPYPPDEDTEHYHEHDNTGKEIKGKRTKYPRPTAPQLLKKAVAILTDDTT
jgi:hypothetical protein